MMSSQIWAIQLPEDVRYFYQLVPNGEGNTEFLLYVERTDVSGIPLHAGSVTLAAPWAMAFEPEEGWSTVAPSFSQGESVTSETGVTQDGYYISFSWYWWGAYEEELPSSSGSYANRQLLGTLTTQYHTALEDIELLPWTETTSGAARLDELNNSPDKEAQMEIMEGVWRMPDINIPNEGYYQGFYAEERTDTDTEGHQYAVDLTAGWQGFTIGAYAPEKPATLMFYQYSDEGTPALYAVAETTFGSGVGYFRGRVDFSALALRTPDTGQAVSLVSGIYDIVILKPSHVKCEVIGVEFDGINHIFPELQGLHVEIPCGDLVTKPNAEQLNLLRGDNVITLQDRSVLQACMNGGLSKADWEYGYADLNGDGVVSLADLDILMSEENYNKKTITIKGKGADI